LDFMFHIVIYRLIAIDGIFIRPNGGRCMSEGARGNKKKCACHRFAAARRSYYRQRIHTYTRAHEKCTPTLSPVI